MSTRTFVPDATTSAVIEIEDEHVAHNYHPLPVIISRGEGAWVTDVEGKRYLDLLSAYSALNFGHRHPAILAAAREQLERLTLTSRAYHNDQLGPFAAALAELCGKDLVLPMNTGAEAVETGIKVARAWGYRVKGIAPDAAQIVVADGNFHGRTTTIVGFSDDPSAREDFGPFTPGFVHVPFGDAEAIAAAITDDTAAVLIEPIQGEAGVVIPPEGYLRRRPRDLRRARTCCSSPTRSSPVSAASARRSRATARASCPTCICSARRWAAASCRCRRSSPIARCSASSSPASTDRRSAATRSRRRSACASSRCSRRGSSRRAGRALGEHLEARLTPLVGHGVTAVRVAGLWAGVDIDPAVGTGREIAEKLLARGVLVKDTHGQTIRIAPPLVVRGTELDWAVEQLALVLEG